MARTASLHHSDAFPGWDLDLRGPVGPKAQRFVRGDRVWLDGLAQRPSREVTIDFECGYAYAEVVPDPTTRVGGDALDERAHGHLTSCFVAIGITQVEAVAAARHCLAEPTQTIPSSPPDTPAELAGWEAMDTWMFTSVAVTSCRERCPHNVRVARVLVGPSAFICVWRNARGAVPWPEAFPRALPQRTRRHSWTVEFDGGTPKDEAARLVQDVMQHHEWFATQLEKANGGMGAGLL